MPLVTMGMRLFLAFFLGASLAPLAHAGEASIYRGQRLGRMFQASPTDKEMEARFPQIQGSWDHFYAGPAGTTCASGALVEMAWKADVQKAYIRLDEQGASVFEIQLGPVDLWPSGYLRDGWLCQWGGSMGRARVTDVAVNFVLSPQEGSPYPLVNFGNLTFKGLQFFDYQVGLRDGWKAKGEIDPWLRQWIEQNLNQLLQQFLASPLKSHLDKFLTAELERMLKEREHEAETGEVMRTRRLPFSSVPFPDDSILFPAP